MSDVALPGIIYGSAFVGGLTMVVYEPSIDTSTDTYTPASVFVGAYGDEVVGWQHEITANGGYGAASFALNVQLTEIEKWLQDGIGRHVVCYSVEGIIIYEGFVNELTINLGGLSIKRGPLMNVGNRVSVVYSPILDATVSPPLIGPTSSTVIGENADSQRKYGILEKVLSGGTVEDDIAEQIRDAWMAENHEPETTSEFDPAQIEIPSLHLECRGYSEWFAQYVYNNTDTTNTTTITQKLIDVIAACPNVGLFSSSTAEIDTNALLAPSYEGDNRDAWTIIQELVAQGDVNDNRWLFGVYQDRVPYYYQIPSTVEYRINVYDRSAIFYTPQGVIPPWLLKPGKFLSFDDMLIGQAITTTLRDDPRIMFIERITFNAPNLVRLEGGKTDRLAQKLAKLGLGGISA